jgi:hypothetical protein
MKTFVLIFRQSGRVLTEQEKKQRGTEVSAWARGINAAGVKLDPRILGEESYAWTEPGKGSAGHTAADATVTALLFLEAATFEEAARVGSEHPALRYGATVEVRPWASPAAPVAPRL